MDELPDEPDVPQGRSFIRKVLPYIIAIAGGAIFFITLILCSNSVQNFLLEILTYFKNFDQALGTLWAFIFMIIGNASNVPVGIPATFFFAKSINTGQFFWGHLTLYALISGLGAAIGQLGVYLLGRGAAKVFEDKKSIKNMQYLASVITDRKRIAPVFVYILAFTPIPDQLIIIPLGIAKYPMKKVFIPSAFGKSTFTFFIAIGATIFNQKGSAATIDSIILEIIFIAVMAIVFVFFFAIDWERVFSKMKVKNPGVEVGQEKSGASEGDENSTNGITNQEGARKPHRPH